MKSAEVLIQGQQEGGEYVNDITLQSSSNIYNGKLNWIYHNDLDWSLNLKVCFF